jgi:hypothetical protein
MVQTGLSSRYLRGGEWEGYRRILSVAICRTVTNGVRTLLLRTLRDMEPPQRLINYFARKIVQNENKLKGWMQTGRAEDRDEWLRQVLFNDIKDADMFLIPSEKEILNLAVKRERVQEWLGHVDSDSVDLDSELGEFKCDVGEEPRDVETGYLDLDDSSQ